MARENLSTWRRRSACTDTYDGRAVALADLWNRGVLDVVVANQNGAVADLQEYGDAGESVD